MPQSKIAELFQVNIPAISKHFKNIFESGELNEKVVVSKMETTTQHGAIAHKAHQQDFTISMLLLQLAIG